jgi:antitoxin (DNA-binding transcriptional repressor) of toxin-antitoxin stability system
LVKRITATDASRNFSRILDEAEHDRESFLVERNGHLVAEIRPAARRSTVEDLLRVLRSSPPDADFERDMRDVLADRDRHYPTDRFDDD